MSKMVEERTRKQLLEIAAMPGNDSCADCKARAPRWASHNLGIFICVRCATVHRKIGTHVTKVKSLTLDSWTKDQVEVMRQNGNLKSNTFFNPNESRNPPPTNLEESERDGELEKYIRSKYEYRRFVDRTPRQQPPPQTQNAFPPPPRAQSTPLTSQQQPAAAVQRPPSAHPAPAVPPAQPVFGNSSTLQYRPSTTAAPPIQARVAPPPAPVPPAPAKPAGGVWDDILAIQSGPAPPTASSLGGNPYANATQANATFAQLSQPGAPAFSPQPQPQAGTFSPNPAAAFAQTQPTGAFPNMAAVSPQPGMSGITQPMRSFTMPAAMSSTSTPFQQPTASPGNPFFAMQQRQQAQQQFTPSPLTSPPIGNFTQQPQAFGQQAFAQQQPQQSFAQQAFQQAQQAQQQAFQQPQQQSFQQPQQQPAFQATPSFFQQAQQPQQPSAFAQQQSAFGQQQPAFAQQQQQPAFAQQQQQQPMFSQLPQQQPAFNLQNFMPQAQAQSQSQMPAQTNPFGAGYPQAGQQQPFAGGAFGQQQMYSQPQPGWPSS